MSSTTKYKSSSKLLTYTLFIWIIKLNTRSGRNKVRVSIRHMVRYRLSVGLDLGLGIRLGLHSDVLILMEVQH